MRRPPAAAQYSSDPLLLWITTVEYLYFTVLIGIIWVMGQFGYPKIPKLGLSPIPISSILCLNPFHFSRPQPGRPHRYLAGQLRLKHNMSPSMRAQTQAYKKIISRRKAKRVRRESLLSYIKGGDSALKAPRKTGVSRTTATRIKKRMIPPTSPS